MLAVISFIGANGQGRCRMIEKFRHCEYIVAMPGVSVKASGRPSPSTWHGASSCGLRVSGQYLAPTPPFCAAGGTVGADNGAVDHMQTIFGFLRQPVEYLLPDPALAPAILAVVTGRIRAVSFRQIAPWASSPQNIIDTVQDASVIRSSCAA